MDSRKQQKWIVVCAALLLVAALSMLVAPSDSRVPALPPRALSGEEIDHVVQMMAAVIDPQLDMVPVRAPVDDSTEVPEAADVEWDSIARGPADELFTYPERSDPNRLLRSTTLNPLDTHVSRPLRNAFASFYGDYRDQLRALARVHEEIASAEAKEVVVTRAGLVRTPVLRRLPSKLELLNDANHASESERLDILKEAQSAPDVARVVPTDQWVWVPPERVGEFEQSGRHLRVNGESFCLTESVMPRSREAAQILRFHRKSMAARIVSWMSANAILPTHSGEDLILYIQDRGLVMSLRQSDRSRFDQIMQTVKGRRR